MIVIEIYLIFLVFLFRLINRQLSAHDTHWEKGKFTLIHTRIVPKNCLINQNYQGNYEEIICLICLQMMDDYETCFCDFISSHMIDNNNYTIDIMIK